MPHAWPLELRDRDLRLRPLRRRDRREFLALRERNREWLAPWDATDPAAAGQRPPYGVLLRWTDRHGRAGTALQLALEVSGRLAGQISVSPINHGSLSSATIGYWVDRDHAGRGIAPRSVALMIDHCFAEIGLHRIEVVIRPENRASRRVVEKLHLRREGFHRRLVHVDGDWRDHDSFALTAEEIPTHDRDGAGRGVLRRYRREWDGRSPGESRENT